MSTNLGTLWATLTPEIRDRIIRLLPVLGAKCSILASVCQEWRSITETLNFAEINLSASRLVEPYTQTILFQKRSQIRYIWFRIELKPYDCDQCRNTDADKWDLDDVDNQSIVDAFQSLFTTLGRWEPRGDLVLDISVYSPSDNQHWFKYLDFRPDTLHACSIQGPAPADDKAHGWAGGKQTVAPEEHAITQTFEEIMGEGPFDDEPPEMEWWRSLPSVHVVGEVRLRQQTRRRWKPVALSNMLTRFPNMNELWWEPWMEFDGLQLHTDKRKCTQTLIDSLSSTKIHNLTIFENFNEFYPHRYFEGVPIRKPSPDVSRKLARASLRLDTLCVSFMADAGYFFAARDDAWTWESLSSLTLTSSIFTSDAKAADVDQLLRDAAVAALQMPKLERMELWNGRKGVAMLFRYQRIKDKQKPAIISVRGTSKLVVGNAALKVWDVVARSHGNEGVVVETSLIDEEIRCHADAIFQLGLSTQVARPASLQQMITEHEARTWTHDQDEQDRQEKKRRDLMQRCIDLARARGEW